MSEIAGSGSSGWLRPVAVSARVVLQGTPAALVAAAAALGLPDADRAGRVTGDDSVSMIWLGPDERLLLGWRDGADALGTRLEAALAAHAHSLVDVTQRQVGLRLHTPSAAELLNCGCPLDLDPVQFPVGDATRTLFNKSDIVLWRRGVDDFHIEVWRSFEDYLRRWLTEAAQDLPQGR